MGIHVQFNTDDLSEADVLVLGALARSLADPEWAKSADAPEEKAPAKRGPGRPRKTDEQRAAEAAEKAAAEKAAKDEAERVATEKAAAVADAEPEEPAEKAEKPAPAPRKAAAKAKSPEPAEEASDDSEDTKAEAVRLATALVHDGRGAEIRNALKEVGAKKVSDLDGKSLDGFLAIAREL